MTWRIIQISSNSKLELKLNYMVVRNGDETKRVYIPEIAVLIIESTAISLTASLLCELNRNKVKIIFCDEKRNPYAELYPYYGTSDSVEKLRLQVHWDTKITMAVWTEIVREKISKQRDVLLRLGHTESTMMLDNYLEKLQFYDSSNREGHAAKVYFNTVLGNDFSRRDKDNIINAALDYGYSILLSAFNREIAIAGYNSQIGIFHDNVYNPFNLASDLMEPFRPIVDEKVLGMELKEFGSKEKQTIMGMLNTKVIIDGKQQYLLNAIRVYVQSVFNAIEEKDISRLKFYEAEIHESDNIL